MIHGFNVPQVTESVPIVSVMLSTIPGMPGPGRPSTVEGLTVTTTCSANPAVMNARSTLAPPSTMRLAIPAEPSAWSTS